MLSHSQSQLALLESYSLKVSIDLLPCEDCNITAGSTPNSSPILQVGELRCTMYLPFVVLPRTTYLCQCLTIASVESTIVPSISKRIPAKLWVSGPPVKAGFPSGKDILTRECKTQEGQCVPQRNAEEVSRPRIHSIGHSGASLNADIS